MRGASKILFFVCYSREIFRPESMAVTFGSAGSERISASLSLALISVISKKL